jgi:hypothetical protein
VTIVKVKSVIFLRLTPALPEAGEHEQLTVRIVDVERLLRRTLRLPLKIPTGGH